MSEQNETLAGIVAEMRGTDNKCQLATKDGTGCYHCPFGSAASNCLFDKFADRIEAAHKREVDKLNSVIQAQRSAFDAEQDRQRRAAPGDAAALREALSDACYAMFNFLKTRSGGYEEMANALDKAKAALAAPARNCDVFGTKDKSREAFQKLRGHWVWADVSLWDNRDEIEAFLDWLFLPTNESEAK